MIAAGVRGSLLGAAGGTGDRSMQQQQTDGRLWSRARAYRTVARRWCAGAERIDMGVRPPGSSSRGLSYLTQTRRPDCPWRVAGRQKPTERTRLGLGPGESMPRSRRPRRQRSACRKELPESRPQGEPPDGPSGSVRATGAVGEGGPALRSRLFSRCLGQNPTALLAVGDRLTVAPSRRPAGEEPAGRRTPRCIGAVRLLKGVDAVPVKGS